jgi:hypothetical protein
MMVALQRLRPDEEIPAPRLSGAAMELGEVTVLRDVSLSEAEDLARCCHRVIVLRRGVVAGALLGEDLTEPAINNLALRDKTTTSAADGAQ